jgi:uncharacterized protein
VRSSPTGAVGLKDILQCVKTILLTPIRSVMLDRRFGIDMTFVDKPINVALTLYVAEAFAKVAYYEPRVEVVQITWTANLDGHAVPNVKLRIPLEVAAEAQTAALYA